MRRLDDVFPYGLGGAATPNPDGLAEGVAKQLELALTVGLLNDGDKLPAEPRLAEQLGVSTVTLRQGLAQLRNRGVLVTQRGRGGGSYIRDSQRDNAKRASERLAALTAVELRDFGDVLGGLLSQSARLAAQRALADEVERLDRMVAALRDANTPNTRRKFYCRLHLDTAVAAQSPRLMLTSMRLLGQVAPLIWNSPVGTHANFAEAYAALVDAIRKRDPEQAQHLALVQIERETHLLVSHHLAESTQGMKPAPQGRRTETETL